MHEGSEREILRRLISLTRLGKLGVIAEGITCVAGLPVVRYLSEPDQMRNSNSTFGKNHWLRNSAFAWKLRERLGRGLIRCEGELRVFIWGFWKRSESSEPGFYLTHTKFAFTENCMSRPPS